jgi:hypothetical protein
MAQEFQSRRATHCQRFPDNFFQGDVGERQRSVLKKFDTEAVPIWGSADRTSIVSGPGRMPAEHVILDPA